MRVTKQFKFETAHRLVSSYSQKCQSIHGHSYLCRLTLEEHNLNEDGMVMDFGEVKNKINHLFESWDHSLMLWSKDPMCQIMLAGNEIVPQRLVFVDYNPTAENMAFHVYRACVELGLPVETVEIQETATGWATANRLRPFVGENVTYYNIPERKV